MIDVVADLGGGESGGLGDGRGDRHPLGQDFFFGNAGEERLENDGHFPTCFDDGAEAIELFGESGGWGFLGVRPDLTIGAPGGLEVLH